ncbi:MAG: DUF5906 domain-containing protein [Gammaproteobacteria bacterium]|nr:DUF5906 domain-containing protein [Gammaproteobacteria bacterium]
MTNSSATSQLATVPPINSNATPRVSAASSPGTLDQNRLCDPGSCIAELNKRYALVKLGGKALVVDEYEGNVDFINPPDFERLYNNVQVPDGNRSAPLGRHWLNHSQRRQYTDGLVFDPSLNSQGGKYNLWKGFAVEPDRSKACTLFLEHVETVICGGNPEHFEYLLNWLALLVQQPATLPQVALVLKSEQGTGKGLFVEYLGKILGRHYKHLTDKSHLVGRFSGHLHDAVLVFADELGWDGNSKSESGALKGLITEPTRMLEKKFANAEAVKNCVHLIVASNEDWVVPAEISDRRYCVLEVSGCKRGDHDYFDALVLEMQNGGPSRLLYDLLTRDISGFEPKRFPRTSARVSQQLQSLDPIEQWLVERLQLDVVEGADWPHKSPKAEVYERFRKWFRERQIRAIQPNPGTFTSTLKKYGITTGKMPAVNGRRAPGYQFPPPAQFEPSLKSFSVVPSSGRVEPNNAPS